MAVVKKHTGPKGPQRIRIYNGEKVTPTLYDGPYGKYMATIYKDQLLIGESSRPIEFKNAGQLVWVNPPQ